MACFAAWVAEAAATPQLLARSLFGPVPAGVPDDMELLHTFEAGFLTTANRFVALATAAELEPELTKGYT